MKKNRVKSFSKALISASLRGLALFAVFGVALFAYAVNYPATAPGPVSGIVGLYVGQSVSTSDGNVGGYETANDLCASGANDLADSHICTPMEIMNTYNHNPSALPAVGSGAMWINSGPPAYTTAAPNDCNGWINDTNVFFATSWNFDINFGTASSCNLVQPFACCK
ncbi:MAG TPA: hypothetical protein ENK70_06235 [Methylophaga sp.]|nr:hypothetical protein [Methylophaga sp.]